MTKSGQRPSSSSFCLLPSCLFHHCNPPAPGTTRVPVRHSGEAAVLGGEDFGGPAFGPLPRPTSTSVPTIVRTML